MRRAGAAGAGLVRAVIDAPGLLEIAKFAGGLGIVAQAGAAGSDGLGQGFANGGDQGGALARGQAVGRAGGVDASAVQGFARVDIADARDQRLVEEGDFDGGGFGREGVGEIASGEAGFERFGAELGEEPMLILARGFDQVERAEAAGIDEADGASSAGCERKMLVALGGLIDGDAARHAEMDEH